jgi:hypothetical protein
VQSTLCTTDFGHIAEAELQHIWMIAAPRDRIGTYQSVYSTAFSVTGVAGPIICACVVATHGPSVWLSLGGGFFAAGLIAAAAQPGSPTQAGNDGLNHQAPEGPSAHGDTSAACGLGELSDTFAHRVRAIVRTWYGVPAPSLPPRL